MFLPNNEVNPEISKRNIGFTITSGENSVEGAKVSIGDIVGTTGKKGGCTLHEVSDGEHEVKVVAEGYITKTETITVSESNITFSINLESE